MPALGNQGAGPSVSGQAPVRVDPVFSAPTTTPPAAQNRSQLPPLEMEQEEAVGLAMGMAASNRPVMPSLAERQTASLMNNSGGMVPSKYYSGQMVDTIAGVSYDPMTGAITSGVGNSHPQSNGAPIILHWDEPVEPTAPRFFKFLLSFLGILLAAGLCAGLLPEAFVAPLCLATFLGGMLLPIFKLVPWQDEDSDDAIWLFVLLLVFGPAIGLIIYGAVSAVRQEFNIVVFACMGVALIARVIVEVPAQRGFHMGIVNPPWATPSAALKPEDTPSFVASLFTSWTSLLAMLGWYVANIFHKENE